jgi:hypothetical protein
MDYVVPRLAEKNSGKQDATLMRINQLGAERSGEVTVLARSLLPSLDGGVSLKNGTQGKTIVSNLPRMNSSNEEGDFTGYPDIPQHSLLRITFVFNPYRYQYLSPTSTPGS